MKTIVFSPKFNRLVSKKAPLVKLCSGFSFTEGAVWDPKALTFYFTDFPNEMICRYNAKASKFRENSGRAVGLSITDGGRIVAAETRTRTIAFSGEEASEIIVGSFCGKRLNSPNDVIVKRDGSIFFTDPYSTALNSTKELGFNGVFCIPVVNGALSASGMALIDDLMTRPNGLAFSPSEDILYVNNTDEQAIYAYKMKNGYTADKIGLFAKVDESFGEGAVDGMKVDREGNVYVTGPAGIWIFDNSGEPLGIIKVPEFVGNFCFGGVNGDILFITASKSIYMTQLLIGNL